MTYEIDPSTGLPKLPEPYVWYVGYKGYGYRAPVIAIVLATENETSFHPKTVYAGSVTNVNKHEVPELPAIPEHTVLKPVTRTRLFSGKSYTSMESLVIPEVPAVPGRVWYTYTELQFQMWEELPTQGELADSILLELSLKVLKAWEAKNALNLEHKRLEDVRQSKFGLYPPKTLNS